MPERRRGRLPEGVGGADAWVGFWACWAPNIPCIRRKKQLEMMEAKHVKQAEGLRQVRAELGLERECRFQVWVEPGQVQEDGEGCITPSLIGAPHIQGRAADGGGLGQLSGAERSLAGTAALSPKGSSPPTPLWLPPPLSPKLRLRLPASGYLLSQS